MSACHDSESCPCGSSKPFANCCKVVLENHRSAKTAEQLMRSRYTAFTLHDEKHLLKSWAKNTRPESVGIKETSIKWLGLEVENCTEGSPEDTTGTVTFTAHFLSSGFLCQIHECSNFVREDQYWYYVDGESSSERQKIARNSPCPCGSEKKYKRCCCQ